MKNKKGKENNHHTRPISKHNLELIKQFLANLKALPKPPTEGRLYVLAVRLKHMSNLLENKPFDSITEEDIKRMNPTLNKECPNTTSDYRGALKCLWRSLDKKKFRDLIESDYMKIADSKDVHVDPDTFWSQQEIEAYIEESKHHSLKQLAWATIWLSSGCRPGEIFLLKKKHLIYEEPFFIIKVPDGKTGKREVILKNSEAKAINMYLQPYLSTINDDDLLFPHSYTLQKQIHTDVCNQIKLPKEKDRKFYMARKMNVTRFYKLLGHEEGALQSGHRIGSGIIKHYFGMTY